MRSSKLHPHSRWTKWAVKILLTCEGVVEVTLDTTLGQHSVAVSHGEKGLGPHKQLNADNRIFLVPPWSHWGLLGALGTGFFQFTLVARPVFSVDKSKSKFALLLIAVDSEHLSVLELAA